MKKLLVGICLVFFAFNAQAQKVDLGVKLGANFSNMSDVSGVKLKNKTGLVAGAFVSIGTEKFAVQPELLYSQQGAKSDIGGFDLDYINVPIMFKYYLIGNLFNVQVGPQFGFLTHQSLKDQVNAKDFDFSGAAGLGLDLPLGIRVDARYNFGLTKAAEDAKTGVFSLALGYSFL